MLPPDSVLSLIMRKGQKPLVPSLDTVLESGDQIVAVTSHETEESLREELTRAIPEKEKDA